MWNVATVHPWLEFENNNVHFTFWHLEDVSQTFVSQQCGFFFRIRPYWLPRLTLKPCWMNWLMTTFGCIICEAKFTISSIELSSVKWEKSQTSSLLFCDGNNRELYLSLFLRKVAFWISRNSIFHPGNWFSLRFPLVSGVESRDLDFVGTFAGLEVWKGSKIIRTFQPNNV